MATMKINISQCVCSNLLTCERLRQNPLNGWDIMKPLNLVLSEFSNDIPESIYPVLYRLEARRLVEAEWESFGELPEGEVLQFDCCREETNLARNGSCGSDARTQLS